MNRTTRSPRTSDIKALAPHNDATPAAQSPDALAPDALQSAWERIQPEAEALDARTLARFTLDCSHAYTMAIAALPKLSSLDHDLRTVSHFDLRNYTHYADYAMGTYHVHSQVMAASGGDNVDLLALSAEGVTLRTAMLPSLRTLAAHGKISPSVLKGRGSRAGYRALMDDLVAIVAILRPIWSAVGARTLIEPRQIDRASQIAQELAVLLAQRESNGETLETLLPRRQRCATLLIHANKQLRRAVRYLCDDQALDQVVPSVFLSGTPRRAKPSTPVAPIDQPVA